MKRVLSAIVLIALVAGGIYLGPWAAFAILLVLGLLNTDEVLANFLKLNRATPLYLFGPVLFLLIYLLPKFLNLNHSKNITTLVGVGLNLFLLWALFRFPMEKKYLSRVFTRLPYLFVLAISFQYLSLSQVFFRPNWQFSLWILLTLNYAMDSGGWIFGKLWGKTKLWPKVSPKKTVEGFIGGVFLSTTLSLALWFWWGRPISAFNMGLLCLIIGPVSHLGDLVQSKLKREFEIKDSSKLIPGHGGVYDRMDSLLMSAPFFLALVQY